jgi:hypothetical protein
VEDLLAEKLIAEDDLLLKKRHNSGYITFCGRSSKNNSISRNPI